MRPLPPQAALQHGVFTVAQARAAGWTRQALRHAGSCGRFIVLRRGVLAVAPQPTGKTWLAERAAHQLAAAAAVLARPGALASHVAAALLVDLPVLTTPQRPCLTVPAESSGDVPGVHLHRTVLDRGERCRFGLLGLTLPHRTVVDIARELGEAAGVSPRTRRCAAGCSPPMIWTAPCGPRQAARAMAAVVDPRAESPLESVSRLAIRDAGLPAPWLQPNILVDGRFAGRPDFLWDEFGVVGEADGWEKSKRPVWLSCGGDRTTATGSTGSRRGSSRRSGAGRDCHAARAAGWPGPRSPGGGWADCPSTGCCGARW